MAAFRPWMSFFFGWVCFEGRFKTWGTPVDIRKPNSIELIGKLYLNVGIQGRLGSVVAEVGKEAFRRKWHACGFWVFWNNV